jgi:hypothetical protein
MCSINHNWSSWNNFHEKTFRLFTKISVCFISILGFVSTFKKFSLGGVECFLKISPSLRLL